MLDSRDRVGPTEVALLGSQAHSNSQVSTSPKHSENKTCTRHWVYCFSKKRRQANRQQGLKSHNFKNGSSDHREKQDLRTDVGEEGTKGEEGRRGEKDSLDALQSRCTSSLSKPLEHFNISNIMHEIT